MWAVFTTTLPFFILVLGGYVATRKNWLTLNSISGLNAFILYFALPCLLFRFGAQTRIESILLPGVGAIYIVSAFTTIALSLLLSARITRHFRRTLNWKNRALTALVSTFPNTGFMGVPLLFTLAGEKIVGIVIITIIVDMVLTSSACLALANLDSPSQSFKKSLATSIKTILKNPMPWALLLGVLSSVFQIALPSPIGKTMDMLADSASGLALFTIGAVIARTRILLNQQNAQALNTIQHHPLAWFDYLPFAALKLFVHPFVVWLSATAAQNAGLGITPFEVAALTLVAALPSASNVSLLAERMQADNGRISYIILWSTALAFFSFSTIAYALLSK